MCSIQCPSQLCISIHCSEHDEHPVWSAAVSSWCHGEAEHVRLVSAQQSLHLTVGDARGKERAATSVGATGEVD